MSFAPGFNPIVAGSSRPPPPSFQASGSCLSHAQEKAAAWGSGVAIVEAGPGSGKTRVIVERVRRLIARGSINPSRIVVVTFTSKAAREIGERVSEILPPAQAQRVWIGTFHSIAMRLLRGPSGNGASISVIDSSERSRLIARLVKEDDVDESAKTVAEAISRAKRRGPRRSVSVEDAGLQALIAPIAARYASALADSGQVDFDDLLANAVTLLRGAEGGAGSGEENAPPNPAGDDQMRASASAVAKPRGHVTFEHVMVDEFQDTNWTQFELARLLARHAGNLLVVGDSDQRIYGWRLDGFDGIAELEARFPQRELILLAQNYRSSRTIVSFCNALLAGGEGGKRKAGGAAARAKERPQRKRLWTKNPPGADVVLYEASDAAGEATFVATQIARLRTEKRGSGFSYSDVSVLYRSGAQALLFERAFIEASIPYTLRGGVAPLLERRECRDILAYLRLAANPNDARAFQRAVAAPKRGVGSKTQRAVVELARRFECSIVAAIDAIAAAKRAPPPVAAHVLQAGQRQLAFATTVTVPASAPPSPHDTLAAAAASSVSKPAVAALVRFAQLIRAVGGAATPRSSADAGSSSSSSSSASSSAAAARSDGLLEDAIHHVLEQTEMKRCLAAESRKARAAASGTTAGQGVDERWGNCVQLAEIARSEDVLAAAAEHESLGGGAGAGAGASASFSGRLCDFLAKLSLGGCVAAGSEASSPSVELSTFHSCKGLEWPIVFVSGVEEGLLPHHRSSDDAAKVEEERRLLFVAASRASQKLFLTYANKRGLRGVDGGRVAATQRSRFLTSACVSLCRLESGAERRRSGGGGQQQQRRRRAAAAAASAAAAVTATGSSFQTAAALQRAPRPQQRRNAQHRKPSSDDAKENAKYKAKAPQPAAEPQKRTRSVRSPPQPRRASSASASSGDGVKPVTARPRVTLDRFMTAPRAALLQEEQRRHRAHEGARCADAGAAAVAAASAAAIAAAASMKTAYVALGDARRKRGLVDVANTSAAVKSKQGKTATKKKKKKKKPGRKKKRKVPVSPSKSIARFFTSGG